MDVWPVVRHQVVLITLLDMRRHLVENFVVAICACGLFGIMDFGLLLFLGCFYVDTQVLL